MRLPVRQDFTEDKEAPREHLPVQEEVTLDGTSADPLRIGVKDLVAHTGLKCEGTVHLLVVSRVLHPVRVGHPQ